MFNLSHSTKSGFQLPFIGFQLPLLDFSAQKKPKIEAEYLNANTTHIYQKHDIWVSNALKVALFASAAIAVIAAVGALANPVGITFTASLVASFIAAKMIVVPLATIGAVALVSIPIIYFHRKIELNSAKKDANSMMQDLKNLSPFFSSVDKKTSHTFDIQFNQSLIQEQFFGRNLTIEQIQKTFCLTEYPSTNSELTTRFLDSLGYGLPKIPVQYLKDFTQRPSPLNQVELPNQKAVNFQEDSNPDHKLTQGLNLANQIYRYVQDSFPGHGQEHTKLREKIRNTLYYYCSQEFFAAGGALINSCFSLYSKEELGLSTEPEMKNGPIDIKFERIEQEGPIKFKVSLKANAFSSLASIDFELTEEFEISPDKGVFTQNRELKDIKAQVTFL